MCSSGALISINPTHMSFTNADAKHHNHHPHRYAHSHHPHHGMAAEELPTVARSKATTCEHKFVHTGDKSIGCTEAHATLIAHLEEQSLQWVEKYTERVNGEHGGLSMKFALGRTKRIEGSARDDPESAISILETLGA